MTDPDEIKAEIEATRAELAESADALAAKLNVRLRRPTGCTTSATRSR